MQFTVKRPKHIIPAIGKLGRTVILWWRRRRLGLKGRQNMLDTLDLSFFSGALDYESYKRERDRIKRSDLPI